ncbi:MAG: cation:proton antiporter subunit C [Spirochaetaceae bacterium]|nr:cation:proton antiporter subunit C [Myxococcales bacterium]MCB9724677.1 cation:proton antiporter subunit C [Spirochaetaceae bacterium]HPG26896.1 cation:proton antiporter subunit C [Myxococcota bacterium]
MTIERLVDHLATHWNYLAVIVLMMSGLYIAISRGNLVKKIMGMNVFQASVILMYVSMGKIHGGTAPILVEGVPDVVYTNPVPHVLMLTAIVVGVASTALGLALVVRTKEAYGTVEEDEIVALDRADDEREMATERAERRAAGAGA